jgi:hypothetical protein
MNRLVTTVLASGLLLAFTAGCGSSSSTSQGSGGASASPATAANSSSTASGSSGGAASGVGALSAEAKSVATGDIPDTQVFLTYHNAAPSYGISYPEGWTRRGSGNDVTFSDKNNIVHIVITTGGVPTPAALVAELSGLRRSSPTLTFTSPQTIQLKSGPAVKATYSTRSAPNPVTGKSVLLIVDRYQLSHAGQRATVDLGTAKGVDNVDAYRRMINSFRWQ